MGKILNLRTTMLVCEKGHRTPFLCGECDGRVVAKTETLTGEDARKAIEEAEIVDGVDSPTEQFVTTKLSVTELVRENEDLRLFREIAQKKLSNPAILSSIEKTKVKGRTLSSLLGKHQQLAMKWM